MFALRKLGRRAFASVGVAGAGFALASTWAKPAFAHCQVPCGIYNDPARIAAMQEDVKTIAKAMAQVQGLAQSSDAQSVNQATRWIMTKEQHASNIITTVSEYFLTQKVKEVSKTDHAYQSYLEILAMHHKVMRLAMKAKQSADPKVADALAHELSHLAVLYTK
eukprot:CAMPEP_0170176724 /NCGR_PEP_ID=MMETSP0040_2-20121228/9539_1 /TAXON_ID=641309 /ORGANISM="Lotharella oceanica, Strain CCMP622" /LENGTH=163 /DNA_ID=CAMNT_0010419141 /DNA_START=138 /DNA_END=629 /DNA_ORIENTATION=+